MKSLSSLVLEREMKRTDQSQRSRRENSLEVRKTHLHQPSLLHKHTRSKESRRSGEVETSLPNPLKDEKRRRGVSTESKKMLCSSLGREAHKVSREGRQSILILSRSNRFVDSRQHGLSFSDGVPAKSKG